MDLMDNGKLRNVENLYDIPLYCLVNRDPYNGF